MSQYMHFYMRGKDNFFYPIATFSRSHPIYQFFSKYTCAPYEKITRYDASVSNSVRNGIRNDYDAYMSTLTTHEIDVPNTIANFNNTVEEKMQYIQSNLELIADLKESVKECQDAFRFCDFLDGIVEEAYDTKYAEKEEFKLDSNQYVYYGIEGCYPTLEDVVE